MTSTSLINDISDGIYGESAAQLHQSVLTATTATEPTYLTGLDTLLTKSTYARFVRGDIVELQSTPTSGTDQLLLFLTMTSILPYMIPSLMIQGNEYKGIVIGGKNRLVVWFDCTENRLDIRRLATLLHSHLLGQIIAVEGVNARAPELPLLIQELVTTALTSLIVFHPTSTLSLAISIRNLPDYYKASNFLKEINYVIVLGLSELQHADLVSSASVAASSTKPLSPSHQPAMRHLLSSLAHLRSTLSPIIFLSTYILTLNASTSAKSHQNFPFYPPSLPPPFPTLSTQQRTSTAALADPNDPILPPLLPSSESPSVWLDYHVTVYPPPLMLMAPRSSLEAVLKVRDAKRKKQGQGTEGYVAILRMRGGKELGSWTFDVRSAGIES